MTLSIFSNFLLGGGPDIWEIMLRMALTAVFVGIIGIERQLRQKIAGVTTHLMVAFGACGIAILQDALYFDAIETAKVLMDQGYDIVVQIQRQRVIAQVVTGVGFLGAGTILKTRNGIYGLTTAATLWLASMIGLCFGLGAYALGIVISLFSVIFLTFFRKLLARTSLKHVESPEIIGSERVDD
ncbi:MgtC/SapB family protein [Mycoplasmatota bacterium WC30]